LSTKTTKGVTLHPRVQILTSWPGIPPVSP
jgi:hypothetical protein